MKLRRKIGRRMLDGAATAAAYALIGGEVIKKNATKDNARKAMVAVKGAAISSGRLASQTASNAKQTASKARLAVNKRKNEIVAAKSDDKTLS